MLWWGWVGKWELPKKIPTIIIREAVEIYLTYIFDPTGQVYVLIGPASWSLGWYRLQNREP